MQAPTIDRQQRLRLDGLRVLVVEDEYYIADDLRRHLVDAGALVLGPAPTISRAIAAIESEAIDCAIIDLNLHGESSAPVADSLAEHGIPFAIATGYGSGSVPDRHKAAPRSEKPFDADRLFNLLSQLTAARAV